MPTHLSHTVAPYQRSIMARVMCFTALALALLAALTPFATSLEFDAFQYEDGEFKAYWYVLPDGNTMKIMFQYDFGATPPTAARRLASAGNTTNTTTTTTPASNVTTTTAPNVTTTTASLSLIHI